MTSQELYNRVESDPLRTHWVKYALQTLRDRDVVDAIRDVSVLMDYLKLKQEEGLK